MEDVLDLYAEAPDPKRPVVCFDESPIQLLGEVRQSIAAQPGQPERYDCEYRRNGTVNLFVFLDAHRPWRTVKVTAQRAALRKLAKCRSRPAEIGIWGDQSPQDRRWTLPRVWDTDVRRRQGLAPRPPGGARASIDALPGPRHFTLVLGPKMLH
jgi:hypothetical protein